jgi:hypothetical protein
MGLMNNKRGISPLIATVLLIALSVGMGVAVMSWGEEYIEAKAEFVQGVQETVTSCDLVQFSIIRINNVDQLCLADTTIKGLMDNGPDVNIENIHARVVGEKGVYVDESILDKPLPKGSATPIAFSIGDLGAIGQVKFTPTIITGGKPMVCTKQALVAENIRKC